MSALAASRPASGWNADVGRRSPHLAVARHIASFLNARDLARVGMSSRYRNPHDTPLAALATEALAIAEARVARLLSEGGPGGADGERCPLPEQGAPTTALVSLPMRRGGLCSWLDALDELEAWDGLRHIGTTCRADTGSEAAQLPSNSVLLSHLGPLREAEDLCRIPFPPRSLYYARVAHLDAAAPLFSWRSRLVAWAHSLVTHFALLPTVVADAVGLVDRYVVAHLDSLTRSRLQLVFITALCTAARVAGASPPILAALRSLASEYPLGSIEATEASMASLMGEADAVGQAPLPHGIPLPAEPPGILSRFGLGPSGGDVLPPDVEVVVLTTPTALAGHLLGLLPAAWIPRVTAPMHEALLSAMMHITLHRYSPVTIAAASLIVAIRAAGLAAHPTATAWLSLVERSLHVDLESLRACAERLRRLAEPGSALAALAPLPNRDCGRVAVIVAARSLGIELRLLLPAAPDPSECAALSAAVPAPVSERCCTAESRGEAAAALCMRADVLRACVVAEAVLRGAPLPDAVMLASAAAASGGGGGGDGRGAMTPSDSPSPTLHARQ